MTMYPLSDSVVKRVGTHLNIAFDFVPSDVDLIFPPFFHFQIFTYATNLAGRLLLLILTIQQEKCLKAHLKGENKHWADTSGHADMLFSQQFNRGCTNIHSYYRVVHESHFHNQKLIEDITILPYFITATIRNLSTTVIHRLQTRFPA